MHQRKRWQRLIWRRYEDGSSQTGYPNGNDVRGGSGEGTDMRTVKVGVSILQYNTFLGQNLAGDLYHLLDFT